MTGNIETREFLMDDYDRAIELWSQVEGLDIAEGDDRESISRFLKQNRGLSRVATDGSTVVGVALCGHDGRRGYIYHLAVNPEYQGRGLGKRLVDECLEGLKRAGLQRANILVAKDNPRGREFWRRSGWEDLDGAAAMGRDVCKQKAEIRKQKREDNR